MKTKKFQSLIHKAVTAESHNLYINEWNFVAFMPPTLRV